MEIFDIVSELYGLLGSLTAKLNWTECCDSNKSNFFRLKKKINILKARIDIIIEESEGSFGEESLFQLECTFERRREDAEADIEVEHRPADLFFNTRALFIYTNKIIPRDIQIGLSFGYKFLFPYSCSDDNLHRLLAQLEMTVEQAVPVLNSFEISYEIRRILKNENFSKNYNDTLSWLKFVSKRSASFFEKNPDVVAVKTDKGGHTAILDLSSYNDKLEQHLSDNVYVNIQINPLKFLVSRETELVDRLLKFPVVKTFSRGLVFQPNILSLAKFY